MKKTETRLKAKLKDFSVSRDGRSPPHSRVATTVHYRRGDWDARTETDLAMTSDKTHFHMDSVVKTYIDGEPFIERAFKRSIKRDCV